MKIEQSNFGNIENQEITLYTLKNANGIEVNITNYGATITAIKVPNSNGIIENIACGFDSLGGYFSEEYKNNAPYFGGTIGRYCSQIKNASFDLNGKTYNVAANCGGNNLHGGIVGFDKKVWSVSILENGIEMSLVSKDMEEGFPGNVAVKVVFILNDENELSINYNATPDADTPLSLTNHTYFNLLGFTETVENHITKVHTDKRLVTDATGAATGEVEHLEGKVDDLRGGKRIGDVHQLMNDGFEHFYIFDNTAGDLRPTASIISEANGRSLDVFTTEPCMLLYTGKYTSDALKRESGEQYGKYKGFCCETHRYPNGPNIENSPKSITKAGEEFKSTTIFKFGW